jgi:DNA-binding Xre family transcriptional regulator
MTPLSPQETRARIQDLLIRKGKNIKWLSEKLGISGNNLYKMINGSVQKIPSEIIAQISVVLDCDTDYLLLSDTTERKEISDVSAYLGISPAAVRYIRSLKSFQKIGLDTVSCKRSGFDNLLQIFGEQKTFAQALNIADKTAEKFNFSDNPSAFDIEVFKASRITSKIMEWIRH